MNIRGYTLPRAHFLACLLAALAAVTPVRSSMADHTPPPVSVTVAGSCQSEVGCPGDWQPDCATTHLTYDMFNDLWTGNWMIPAGSYEYKAAINDSWAENYGIGGAQDGPNIPLNLAAETMVFFSYNPHTHVLSHSSSAPSIVVAPGSFQSEIGCPGDWMPDCLASQLAGPDANNDYEFSTTTIPTGIYEFKIALDLSWNVNYGEGGVQNGPNVPFAVPAGMWRVTFGWNGTTHVPTVTLTDLNPIPVQSTSWGAIKARHR